VADLGRPVSYLDTPEFWDHPDQLRMELIFDESHRVAEFDCRALGPRPGSEPEVRIFARTVAWHCSALGVLTLDHFVPVSEPTNAGLMLMNEFAGTFNILEQLLSRLGWTDERWPGSGPVRREQRTCWSRSEAVRATVGAADGWIGLVREATEPVRQEMERSRAVRVLSGEGAVADPTGEPR